MSISLPEDTFDQPLPAFLDEAHEMLDEYEWSVPGDALFHFVRAMKAHCELRGLDAEKAYAKVMAACRKRRNKYAAVGHDLSSEDGQVAFYDIWERARFAMGMDPVQEACELAPEGVIRTNKKRPGRYERFLTIAALLQIQRRQQPIFLPVRKLAENMGCEPNTVTAWIKWATEDGVLIKVKEHAFRSSGGSEAAEYVLALNRWKDALPKLSALIGITLTDRDLGWIRRQFEEAAA